VALYKFLTIVNLFGSIILTLRNNLANHDTYVHNRKNIRKYRKERNFSQNPLSKEAEITYNTIVKIESEENSNPTIDNTRTNCQSSWCLY